MTTSFRRIAVLTSGGDAPGMNAALRAVVRTAHAQKVEVLGVRSGYRGLVSRDHSLLGPRDVSNIIQRGGTVLGTSRCPELFQPEGRRRAYETLVEAKVDGLVVIGGNGSYQGAHLLFEEFGVAVVGIPGTIDNDVSGTETTIGFDTAVNTALQAIDRIRDTAFSTDQAFFVEVMGRHCGAIAIASALAGGAEEVLVPERPDEAPRLTERLRAGLVRGKRSLIVIVAEGEDLGGAEVVARQMGEALGISTRVTVLGHIQRGGSPTAADRILASRMGVAAVEALLRGETDVMTCARGGAIVTAPLREGWAERGKADEELLRLCAILAQ
jgi:6-phosphofructokinase 1